MNLAYVLPCARLPVGDIIGQLCEILNVSGNGIQEFDDP